LRYRDLARELRGMGWWNTGQGGAHEKWTNGRYSIAVPRHREINENTAMRILKQARDYNRLTHGEDQ
jgi:hypothetical protein